MSDSDKKVGLGDKLAYLLLYGGGAFVIGAWSYRALAEKKIFGAPAAAYGEAGYSALPINQGGGFSETITNTSEVAAGELDYTGRSEDTRLNSSHTVISYAVFCLKKKKTKQKTTKKKHKKKTQKTTKKK